MNKNRQSKTREVNDNTLITIRLITSGFEFLNNTAKYGSFVLIAYFGSEAISSLSEKITDANIVFDVLGNWRIAVFLSLFVGIVGILYGLNQRNYDAMRSKNKHKELKNLKRNKILEGHLAN